MARLIDADALKLWLVNMLTEFDDDNDPHEIKREMFQCVLSKVRKMSVIDAVPVRCRECEYSAHPDGMPDGLVKCVIHSWGGCISGDFYCGDAVRKEDNDATDRR